MGIGGIESAINTLKDKHESEWIRQTASDELAMIGKPAVPYFIQLLKNKDSFVRASAAGNLGVIGDQAALPALMEALKDKDKHVRKMATESLDALKGKR